MLLDSFGRKLDYLRISVTDRCNQRCVYCMPPEGVKWKPHDSLLRFEEILRLCRVMAELGISRIRVTGGEPLVRRGVAAFLKGLKLIHGVKKVSLTTNGFFLGAYLDEAEALSPASFPDCINISLDALDVERFKRITRTENFNPMDVLPIIDRLLEKQILVKLNCVPVRGLNEEELLPLAALARDRNISVRFIELMPLGSAGGFKPISGSETAAQIERAFGLLTPFPGVEGSGPAEYFSLPGFAGKIGFINPLSRGFCGSCNRLRLSSDGKLKPCLSDVKFLDLKTMLRSGASDEALAEAVKEAVSKKPRHHNLSPIYGAPEGESGNFHKDGMFGIGG